MKKKAIITGITGQDGSYLAKYLIKKNYKVYGILKKKKIQNLHYLKIQNKINYLKCNLSNYKKISLYIKKIKPDLFFNLAGITSLKESYQNPLYTDRINNAAVLNILESIKRFSNKTRFFQASSSELFSEKVNKKVDENSKFNPISPYAITKLSAHYYVDMYRKNYKIYAVNGILFNHESPLRNNKFLTKKIVRGLIDYKYHNHKYKIIQVGNIYAKRDWGNAEDYVKVIYKTLKINKPYNFIICTGKKYSVKDFINLAAKNLDIKIKWIKLKKIEKIIDNKNKNTILQTNKKLFRDDSLYNFIGDNSKAKKLLKWKPDINILTLVKNIVDFELSDEQN
jgi:GDPmannose 4,6-dehydratase